MNSLPASSRILIVEDHVGLAENLAEFFGSSRYILDFASDGLTALHLVACNEYDVIILDIMLPGLSGYELCRRIRSDMRCTTPVIMVTSKDQLRDKEEGFLTGADDYLVKPFDLRELQLRVDALQRRSMRLNDKQRYHIDGLSYDPGTLEVRAAGGTSLELSGTAARIFEELMRAYPDFVSYEQLQDRVWGEREVDMNTLRTHVYALRKLLHENFGRGFVKTLHGRGYRLLAPGEPKP